MYYGPALMWDEIRRRVGDDAFWEMVRAWPSHDPDGSSNRDDYLPWIEEQTGAELSDLFVGVAIIIAVGADLIRERARRKR